MTMPHVTETVPDSIRARIESERSVAIVQHDGINWTVRGADGREISRHDSFEDASASTGEVI